jgi:hypothetical protein
LSKTRAAKIRVEDDNGFKHPADVEEEAPIF